MNDLIELTDAEVMSVSGGAVQSIYIVAGQNNTSTLSQSATAINYGPVTATATGTGATAAAVGADASNTAFVSQTNVIRAANSIHSHRH
jgi:hypothetical protein